MVVPMPAVLGSVFILAMMCSSAFVMTSWSNSLIFSSSSSAIPSTRWALKTSFTVSMAMDDATSPALAPPMPSATTVSVPQFPMVI